MLGVKFREKEAIREKREIKPAANISTFTVLKSSTSKHLPLLFGSDIHIQGTYIVIIIQEIKRKKNIISLKTRIQVK